MDYEDIDLLLRIIKGMKRQVDDFADGYISTKYKYLQSDMKDLIDFLNERLYDLDSKGK